ncbi:4766_t:CDS:2, partial [Gigaspora rosea]
TDRQHIEKENGKVGTFTFAPIPSLAQSETGPNVDDSKSVHCYNMIY